MITVVYLGRLAEIAGKHQSQFVSTSDEIDWGDLMALLENHICEDLADAVWDEKVKVAHNGMLLADRTLLTARHGDEVALLPPVSGG